MGTEAQGNEEQVLYTVMKYRRCNFSKYKKGSPRAQGVRLLL
jgi:hypothetical protein